ncbi:hypothetical protein D3C81_279570 [compost metagenome]
MLTQLRLSLCEYRYDPLDRLTGHAQPNAPVHQRFYCISRLATEIQGALRKTIFQVDDQILGQLQRQNDSIDVALLATDQQRSVLQSLQKGSLPQPIVYSPYGHHRAESGLSSLLGFNGERADPVTGHYLLGIGYRAFNPVLMRFNSPDSWSPFGRGGVNAYAYVLGNPIGRTDPTGHAPLIGMVGALNALQKHAGKQVSFVGYHVGKPSSVSALQVGGDVAWSGMHRGGKLLGKGLYVTENQASADAFLTRALKGYSGGERPEIFGTYTNVQPRPEILQYGPAFPSGVDPQRLAQFDTTIRIPSNQFDSLVFTRASAPSPVAGTLNRASVASAQGPGPGGGGGGAVAAARSVPHVAAQPVPPAVPQAENIGQLVGAFFPLPRYLAGIRGGSLRAPAA